MIASTTSSTSKNHSKTLHHALPFCLSQIYPRARSDDGAIFGRFEACESSPALIALCAAHQEPLVFPTREHAEGVVHDGRARRTRALVALGENDPDAIIADRLSGESPFLATDKMDLNEGVSFDEEPVAGFERGEELLPVPRVHLHAVPLAVALAPAGEPVVVPDGFTAVAEPCLPGRATWPRPVLLSR